MIGPRELTAIDDYAAQGIAMPAHVFGHGLDDDVRAPLDRLNQSRRCNLVIHYQRYAMLKSHLYAI